MRHLLFAAALLCASPAVAYDENRELLSAWQSANLYCRGSSEEGLTDSACSFRDALHKKLGKLGWCYGKKGQAGYQMAWHRCTAASMRSGE